MKPSVRRTLVLLFFLSGFCSLVYQVVWTRMAFAAFGIITPVLSVVLSVFMLGLALGSWVGGRAVSAFVKRTGYSSIALYAMAELMIGVGAFAVPALFSTGERILLSAGQTDSSRYLILSALIMALSLLPWCVCMGGAFPLMMAYIREQETTDPRSFSYLYAANVLGAMTGVILSAVVLVELLGFQRTLWLAAGINFAIASVAGGLAMGKRRLVGVTIDQPEAELTRNETPAQSRIYRLLFTTGFVAMAMEVVWIRAFTPVLRTQVYSFAMILFAFLGATFLGSLVYRRQVRAGKVVSTPELLFGLSVVVFLPIVANDPRWLSMEASDHIEPASAMIILASICPLCGLLGYLTPGLIDAHASGQPMAAGRAYAVNVLGCILGPLFAGYVLLPFLSERIALILLGLPFLFFAFWNRNEVSKQRRLAYGVVAVGMITASFLLSQDFADRMRSGPQRFAIRRDYAASVISLGSTWDEKRLLVNGVDMTAMSPVTKFMVHLPLVHHQGQAKSALIVCFGMGTSYRSALSWDLDTTAVELVPSVAGAFGFYHEDAAQQLQNPKGRIVVDDGRRYLMRSAGQYDLIVIDPPPPVEAAGSSLLYSREFYELAARHLKANGILQTWFPGGEEAAGQAVVRSVQASFPHVRCYVSVLGMGTHILASRQPVERVTTEQFLSRLPAKARADLSEWSFTGDLPGDVSRVLNAEIPLESLLNPDSEVQVTDDHPFNEYFLLRQWGWSSR